ncbi:PHP domain-containing protein, partial [Klebsiella pneumoniae]
MVVGSRWYKFDFHNHTPASEDYADKTLSDREWLLSYMRRQVDAVIISDHNTGAKIDSLKAELQRMKVDAGEGGLEGFRPLTLFPGVELTATGNVHILAVLNPECT